MNTHTRNRTIGLLSLLILLLLFAIIRNSDAIERKTLSLNGKWNIAEGSLDAIPTGYYNKIDVPGLADMAVPRFSEVGQKSELRDAFWYRRTFTVKGEIPEVAQLKFHKAKFGIKVYVNGQFAGESNSCFTPNYFDIKNFLRGNGETNVLSVCVGAFHDVLPPKTPYGHDFEKIKYIPGIYDDVELILSDTPHLVRLQVAPDIGLKSARIVALVENKGTAQDTFALETTVREAKTGTIVASLKSDNAVIAPSEWRTFDYSVLIENCRLWSPEDPFLYEIEVSTGNDSYKERFGMRSFRFDRTAGRAVLNDGIYFMRGTNVCIFRFFEDPERGDKPWDEAWVRELHRKFKSMNWNSIRYCIGFPPEMWYRIADEEGLLIQDEYPLWGEPENLDKDILIREYTAYMESHWNHPCVVIWDAQNETITNVTGEALQAVRHLDLSNRPWDNGWSEPQAEMDCVETHPYLFSTHPDGPLSDLFHEVRIPHNGPTERSLSGKNFDDYPIVINEYAWLWLNRDGSPTALTDDVYRRLKLQDASASERFESYAYYVAALTEYWRSHRKCAGVLHFCSLGYSRPQEPRGQTCDNFIDLKNLIFEPNFESYVKDSFSPLGVMIDVWRNRFAAGAKLSIPVYVINDYSVDRTVNVRLCFEYQGEKQVIDSKMVTIAANGREIFSFNITMPEKPGAHRMTAEVIADDGKSAKSIRKLTITAD